MTKNGFRPEGSRYLGFIFSRAATPGEAEASLRRAHALLDFTILWAGRWYHGHIVMTMSGRGRP
jgi:hypothetical protein